MVLDIQLPCVIRPGNNLFAVSDTEQRQCCGGLVFPAQMPKRPCGYRAIVYMNSNPAQPTHSVYHTFQPQPQGRKAGRGWPGQHLGAILNVSLRHRNKVPGMGKEPMKVYTRISFVLIQETLGEEMKVEGKNVHIKIYNMHNSDDYRVCTVFPFIGQWPHQKLN